MVLFVYKTRLTSLVTRPRSQTTSLDYRPQANIEICHEIGLHDGVYYYRHRLWCRKCVFLILFSYRALYSVISKKTSHNYWASLFFEVTKSFNMWKLW